MTNRPSRFLPRTFWIAWSGRALPRDNTAGPCSCSRDIPDIWTNKRFDFVDTLEERLIVAGCHYSREKHVALLSEAPPGVAWRKLAQRAGRKLIHVPLKRFSQQTVQQLRMFHILNGQEVRSFAAHFIRKT